MTNPSDETRNMLKKVAEQIGEFDLDELNARAVAAIAKAVDGAESPTHFIELLRQQEPMAADMLWMAQVVRVSAPGLAAVTHDYINTACESRVMEGKKIPRRWKRARTAAHELRYILSEPPGEDEE